MDESRCAREARRAAKANENCILYVLTRERDLSARPDVLIVNAHAESSRAAPSTGRTLGRGRSSTP